MILSFYDVKEIMVPKETWGGNIQYKQGVESLFRVHLLMIVACLMMEKIPRKQPQEGAGRVL